MTRRGASEALELLHTTGSTYLLIYAAFNILVKSVHALLMFYVTSGIVGLAAVLMLQERRIDDLTRFLSAAALLGGLAATGWIYYIGLILGGVVDPGWIIFLLTAWKLSKAPKWKPKTRKRRPKKRVRIKMITLIMMMVVTVSLVGAPLFYMLGFGWWTFAAVYIVFVVVGTILFWQR